MVTERLNAKKLQGVPRGPQTSEGAMAQVVAMAGHSGQPDVIIDNADTVGDFRVLLQKCHDQNSFVNQAFEQLKANFESRVAMFERMIVAMGAGGNGGGKGVQLVDGRTMGPNVHNGLRTEHYKPWAKKVKAFANVKKPGLRLVLEAAEKSQVPVDGYVIAAWNWPPAEDCNGSPHDTFS